ncbi:MAG: hypothetical protein IJU71_03020 [Selenomonadaceae bacterium]|nr:hypothetical protein [Selenomonadaceae bacterium]
MCLAGGDDSIHSYEYDVTLNGGGGNDTVVLASSEQVVYYVEGDGSDLIVELTNGRSSSRVTFAGMTNEKVIHVIDANGADTVITSYDQVINGTNDADSIVNSLSEGVRLSKDGKSLTVKAPFSGTIRAEDYGDKVKTITASSNHNEVEIIGNDLNNAIKASKGGSTIQGGLGNDKLTCGNGADVIVYSDGDGKDTVKKFTAGEDVVQILSGTIDSVKVTGSNVVLNIGDGSISTGSSSRRRSRQARSIRSFRTITPSISTSTDCPKRSSRPPSSSPLPRGTVIKNNLSTK